MLSVTDKKTNETILKYLEPFKKVYMIGCGSCASTLHKGGKAEVLQMKADLEAAGKQVTGWMVIPTACDDLSREAIAANASDISQAEAVLVMSCGYGVQTVSSFLDKPAFPALDTLFVGREIGDDGYLVEVCSQCGDCMVGLTAGICPVTRCAKGLLNGPCGGSVKGKCEVSPDLPCAWQEIYDRLAKLGRLNSLAEIQPPKNWGKSLSGGARRAAIEQKEPAGKK